MTKEENPQTQERDFPLSWKAQTPRFPQSVCPTRYFPDLPTDFSDEARKRGK